MYKIKKIKKIDVFNTLNVAFILYACGKDMAKNLDLHHWDNSLLKSIIIVYYCMLKNNDVYLLYDRKKAIATFQTKINDDKLYFEKLGTIPSKHGKGIGSYCLQLIENQAKESACKSIVTEAFEDGQHAVSFYQKRGFKIIGNTYSIKKRREMVLEKKL